MHDRRFHGELEKLRSPERIARLEVENVIRMSLDGISPKTIIDVGTGTGLFAEAFTKAGLVVTGIDVNAEMVDAARQHVQEGQFLEALAEELPFSDGSFDIVFLGLVLHETDAPLKALTEARRVARERVVILEWPYREEDNGPPIKERLRSEEITRLLRQAGFLTVDRVSLNHVDFYRLRP